MDTEEATSKKGLFRKKSKSYSERRTEPSEELVWVRQKPKVLVKANTISVPSYNEMEGQKYNMINEEKVKDFEKQIYIAKIEGRTVSLVEGILFIDYKCIGPLPEGVRM